MKNYWTVAFENIGTLACFTVLAIHFDKWWLILFSFLLVKTLTFKS